MVGQRQGRPVAWLTLILLGTAFGIWWQTDLTRWKEKPQASDDGQAGAFLKALWARRADHASCIVVDPTGERAGVVGPEGLVRVWNRDGHVVTEQMLPGVNHLAMAAAGEMLAVCTLGDARQDKVVFLRSDGSSLWTHDAQEAIVDLSIAERGNRAACVTSGGWVYVYHLEGRPRARRWRAIGNPRQVYLDAGGGLVVIATDNPPGVWAYLFEGRFAWKTPAAESQGAARLFASPGDEFFVGAFTAAGPQPMGNDAYPSRFVVMSRNGRQQWGARLRAGHPQVALSADGRCAAVTYIKALDSHPQPAYERKVAFFAARDGDSLPTQLWWHGGPLYDPRLVSLAADGSFVVTHDGRRSLYFFGRSGQLLWRHKMASPIARTAVSKDGFSFLVLCSDGMLFLLHASERQTEGKAPTLPQTDSLQTPSD